MRDEKARSLGSSSSGIDVPVKPPGSVDHGPAGSNTRCVIVHEFDLDLKGPAAAAMELSAELQCPSAPNPSAPAEVTAGRICSQLHVSMLRTL
jgi:hypothetical protein